MSHTRSRRVQSSHRTKKLFKYNTQTNFQNESMSHENLMGAGSVRKSLEEAVTDFSTASDRLVS